MRSNVGAARPAGALCVLEVAAVEVVIERVAIVGEGGEDEIHAAVAVVVAGIGAHARLRPRLAVHARRRPTRPTLSKRAVPEVVVQEVGVRVVGDERDRRSPSSS